MWGVGGTAFPVLSLGLRCWEQELGGLDRTDDAKRIVFSLSSLLIDEKLEKERRCALICAVCGLRFASGH